LLCEICFEAGHFSDARKYIKIVKEMLEKLKLSHLPIYKNVLMYSMLCEPDYEKRTEMAFKAEISNVTQDWYYYYKVNINTTFFTH
jgi:uncharacterized protein YlaN (UPF0358 family)